MEQLNWFNLWQQLIAGVSVGALGSMSISLNLRVQKKYKLNPSLVMNLIQGITYFLSLTVLIPSVIYIASNVIGGTVFESMVFVAGVILTVVIAIFTNFIPKESKFNQPENPP